MSFPLLSSLFRVHPEVSEARQLLRAVGDTLLDFGLYSDKVSLFGRYQFPLKLASPPIIVGGWLKIHLHTSLLPKAVGREDLEDERLIAALRARTGRNVESRCLDRLILPDLLGEKPAKPGRGFFSRSVPPNAFDFWYLVELDSAYLRGIPRFLPVSSLPSPNPAHAISWPFGQVSGLSYRLVDFPQEAISMLVAGATRQGKSTYLRSCLTYLQTFYPNFRAILADFKRAQVDFKMFRDDSRFTLVSTPEDLISMVDDLDSQRAAILNASDSLNIFEYNASHPGEAFPYTFVVVDEFAALRLALSTRFSKKDADQLFDKIMVLVATTAGSGIYWVLGTQRPGVDVIPGTLKTNIVTRVCFSMPTAVDGEVVFGDKELGEYVVSLGCPGRAFCSISDSFFEFQSPYADMRAPKGR